MNEQALSVAEVIAELQSLPGDLPVYFAWEGQHIPYTKGCAFTSELTRRRLFGGKPATIPIVSLFAEDFP